MDDDTARRIDRLVPPGLDAPTLRRARVVAVVSALAAATIAAMAIPLCISGTAEQVGQGVGAIGLCLGALVLLRRGYVEAAAWLACLTLTVTPVIQAALDVGVRDPVLALVIVGPMAGAMASGLPLAAASAVIGIAGAGVLLTMYLLGLAPAPISAPAAVAWYAFAVPGFGALVSAGAGALYVRHTRSAIEEAETAADRLGSELRSSEDRYRSLVDSLPIGMYRTSPDGRLLLANQAMAEMMGAPDVEAALGINAATLYTDPGARVAFQNAIRRTGFVRRYETEWRTPGGRVRQVRIDARLTLSPEGEPLYYEGAAEDITAERRARAALAQSEARFRALVQRSSDLVIVLDRAARLTYVSPAAQRLLGLDPDRLAGRDALALVHPDDRTAARAGLATLAAAPTAATLADEARIELRLRHADGHFVYAEAVGAALYHDPAVGGLVLNLRDVTDRKRAQAVLVQAKRQAEEVAHLKSTFLANMSHEIRTPLTAILGFSDILADEITDPQQQEFVDLIARSGRRLMETLNSVLDLARLEAGRGELACVPVRIGDAAEEAATLMGPAAADRSLALTALVDAPDALVALDDAAFARVLHNLVGNALKFTEAGGVTVHVAEGEGALGGRAVVRVVDTGIGIDAAFLPRLFGEFEQESAGLERTHEGAGLGLAISRQLVERMAGTLDVESQKGVGTTFTLTFPLVGAEVTQAERVRVLVVDDNEHARLVAERVLDPHYEVTMVASGEEALAAARAERPAMVLLDIHLGDAASGEDVLLDLRADPDLAHLPVVAVTAYGLPGDRARLLGLGFDGYVTKPYTRERLLDAAEACLDGRNAAPAEV